MEQGVLSRTQSECQPLGQRKAQSWHRHVLTPSGNRSTLAIRRLLMAARAFPQEPHPIHRQSEAVGCVLRWWGTGTPAAMAAAFRRMIDVV